MTSMNTTVRRGLAGVLATCALGVGVGAVAMPAASAAPCDAAGYANTTSGVLSAAGGYLASHPGANDVLTRAASQSDAEAEASVRAYFTNNTAEYFDLQRIVQPLKDLRGQCGVTVSPAQLSRLLDAL